MDKFIIEDSVLVKYKGSEEIVNIPDNVSEIGYGAFYATEVKEVIIPEGVTIIGVCAFEHCHFLEQVKLPNSIRRIELEAFNNCALKEIIIPDSVEEIGNSAFRKCDLLKRVELPNGLIKISNDMFRSCTSLESIAIPDSVKVIDRAAFIGCLNLKDVKLSNNLEVIGELAFQACSYLPEIIIPDSVVTLEKNAFKDCVSLKKIALPDSIAGKLASAIDDPRLENVVVNNISKLSLKYRPRAAVTFAKENADRTSERGKLHLKYIKSNAVKLMPNAIKNKELLDLMVEEKLISAKDIAACIEAAKQNDAIEVTDILNKYAEGLKK